MPIFVLFVSAGVSFDGAFFFFKTKLVSHSIKVRSHCNFLKPFLVYLVKIIKRAV